MNSKNCLISFGDVEVGMVEIALSFSGLEATSFSLMTCPKYVTSFHINLHLRVVEVNFYAIIDRIQLLSC